MYPDPMVPFGKLNLLNASTVRSGDYLAIARLDGLDPMIMWVTMELGWYQRGLHTFSCEPVPSPSPPPSPSYLLPSTRRFGTGGRTGHSAVAVWEGTQLYVVESTDSNPFGATYWPPPYGIIRTPYVQACCGDLHPSDCITFCSPSCGSGCCH